MMPASSEMRKELCNRMQFAARGAAELFFLTVNEKQAFVRLQNYALSFCAVVAGVYHSNMKTLHDANIFVWNVLYWPVV